MVGGLKYQEMIKTQLLRRPAPRKVHKRKYKSLFESRGQNDPLGQLRVKYFSSYKLVIMSYLFANTRVSGANFGQSSGTFKVTY